MKKQYSFLSFIVYVCVVILFLSGVAVCQEQFTEDLLKNFRFRNLGPYRAGSWITDIAVPDIPEKDHLYTFYVGARNGGVWKTTNNGTTFEPVFDGQEALSIGDIAIAQSNPDVVWVGTGESYNARSSYWGDGIYKSTDAGKTWTNMGLKDTHHIPRIVIHPKNPDIVFVAAMGHLFTANEERGVFKTEDGGKTWKKVLYINENVGVIDLVINLKNPDILYAATYEKYRYPWHYEEGGTGSGIYKTTDSGKTWALLKGGLPEGKLGKIGLDIYQKNPDILYAVIENANSRPVPAGAAYQIMCGGDVYRTDDGGITWNNMISERNDLGGKAAYSFNQIRIDPNDDKKIYITGSSVSYSEDGGKTWNQRRVLSRAFGDFRTLWIDPQNSDRIIAGSDGGVSISYDGGRTCDYYDNLPLGEVYALGVDMETPYNIYCGLQDHESWKGPSNGWSGSITIADWITVGVGDGMYNVVDPTDSRWLYNTQEFGTPGRVDQKSGTRTIIAPRRPQGQPPYRFTWVAPLHLSPHNSKIIYAGAQVLLRSLNQGNTWQEISPDLTLNDPVKTRGRGNIQYCTITTISESPVTAGVIWVGTDDGKVWHTGDFGAHWVEHTKQITGLGVPEDYWVSRVFTSYYNAGTAYVSKTGFRNDDFRAFLYKTTDFGSTWTTLKGNLPDESINVVIEDRKNPDLLVIGTDKGLYLSVNGGQKWVRLKNNMPTVPVHDIIIHPRENDLIVGTYGRGIWITDITPLQELTEDILNRDFYFFSVESKTPRTTGALGNYQLYGNRHISVPNEPNAVVINYYVKNVLAEGVRISITDPYGKSIQNLTGRASAGINSASWNIDRVQPGEYVVAIEAGGNTYTQRARVIKPQEK